MSALADAPEKSFYRRAIDTGFTIRDLQPLSVFKTQLTTALAAKSAVYFAAAGATIQYAVQYTATTDPAAYVFTSTCSYM